MDQFERLISDNPQFHRWADGKSANWAVRPGVLRFLRESLRPSMHTVETGAGQTTVVFAIAGTQHTCITADRGEAERIRSYCHEQNIEENITFIHESSDIGMGKGSIDQGGRG